MRPAKGRLCVSSSVLFLVALAGQTSTAQDIGLLNTAPSLSSVECQNTASKTQAEVACLHSLAKAALQHNDLDGAEKYFRQSLSIAKKLDKESLAVARSLNGLGDVSRQRGMPPDAEAYYQEALAIIQKLDPSGADAPNSLDGLARVANDCGDVANSEEYAQQAFAIRQKLDSNSLDFALSLYTMGSIHSHFGEWRTERASDAPEWDKAETSYKQALSLQEKLAPESLVLAETLSNLGRFSWSRRHRFDEACSYFRRALTIREKLAPDSLAVADSLRWLSVCVRDDSVEVEKYLRPALTIQQRLAPGSVHVAMTLDVFSAIVHSRGDWLAAEGYDRERLAIWEKLTPHGARTRSLMFQVSNTLVWRGDLDGAEELARRGLEESRKVNPVSQDVAYDLFTLGNVAMARGDLASSDDYYHQALAISEKVDPDGMMPARMMRGLGMIAEDRGDLAKAEEYYQGYVAFWEKASPNSNNVAQGLFSLGSVAHDRGDLAQTEQYYERALAIWKKTSPDGMFVAQALGKLGRLARDQGDLAQSEERQRQAIAIEQKWAPGSPDLAQGFSDLGDVLLARGALSEALESHQQALALREKLLPGSAAHAASLAALGGIMRRKNQPVAAAQYYEQSLDALEHQAARLGSRDELRAGFRAQHANYYKNYIDLLVGQKRFELALGVLERSRARTLLETLAAAHVDVHQGADPDLIRKERSLQISLKDRSERRISLLSEKHSDEQIKVFEKEISALTSEYEDVETQLRSRSPGYAALTQPQPLTAREIQKQLLDADTLLLEYSLGEERSHVFVVSAHSIEAVALPKRAVIEKESQHVYDLLTERNRRKKNETDDAKAARVARSEAEYPGAVARLSKTILGPIAGQLTHKRLLILGDGALYFVPFAALPVMLPGKSSMPLAAEHEIVTLPSASVLAALRHEGMSRKPGTKMIAVLADPVFDRGDTRVKALDAGSLRAPADKARAADGAQEAPDEREQSRVLANLTRSATDVGWEQERSGPVYLPRLLFTRQEANEIAGAAPAEQSFKALDFKASRPTALSSDLANYRIVHFATHAFLNNEHPELSGLVLSLVDEQGRAQNGFVDLEDIYNLKLPADLVVLSACETGLGKEINGEGLIGLTRGFMYAGATRVVSSLWKIDDRATAEFMRRFYAALLGQKMRPAAALRAAQLAMRNDKHWSSPYYWAAFQIQGEWQ